MELKIVEVINLLRKAGTKLRVHGNGFIQLDLDSRRRFHFWGDHKIPRQAIPSPIHDHTFGFTSSLLYGEVGNVTYSADESDTGQFDVLQAFPREGSDTEILPNGVRVDLKISGMNWYIAPEAYSMPEGQFHETVTRSPAITLITKGLANPLRKPRVLIEHHQLPDNKFDRNSFSQERLWDVVADIFRFHGEAI